MSAIRKAVAGFWDFLVGDDWVTAAGVVIAIGATAAIAGTGAPAWWVMPAAVFVILAVSLRRAAG